MKLISLNWRGQAARWHAYFREGLTLHNEIKQVIYVGAALKIIGLPLYMLAVMTPPLIVYLMLSGYWFVRHGWKRHSSEITLIDQWERIEVWKLWMWYRILEKLGIHPLHFDQHSFPPEIGKVFASTHHEGGPHDSTRFVTADLVDGISCRSRT